MQKPSNPCKHGQRTLNEGDDDDFVILVAGSKVLDLNG